MNRILRIIFFFLLPLPLLLCAQEQTIANEGRKIIYDIQTDFVVSTGNNTPFWLVNNRHGQSSLEDTNANLSVGIYHDFDKKQRFNWGYGIELVGAYNHPKTFYVQQFYTDVKYNCWELSLGSKERWAEGKHQTLSAGGLTFSQNARPIPQVRFGINEYTQVPWWFNGWVQVKGHFSYGWYTDSKYMLKFVQNATNETLYMQDILLHEKTAFLKIGNPQKSSLSFEFGLEMYCQFGGSLYKKTATQELLVYELPHTYKEYIKAFIPLAGGKNTPTAEQTNINGNQLGSWHFITNYNTPNMAFKFYYEHFFEDHSQMIGFAFNRDWKGEIQKISYLPWSDGLWGIEVNLPQFHYITSFVYEYTELKDQSGPILHNSSNSLTEQVSGFDCYYHHYIYQGWQHWGMGLGTPLATSAAYNKNGNPTISSSRIKAHHLGIEGNCSNELSYRLLTTYVRHWGTYRDPLKDIGYQVSTLIEMQYKLPLPHITCKLSLAKDWSNTVIGDNTGASLTIKYTPSL